MGTIKHVAQQAQAHAVDVRTTSWRQGDDTDGVGVDAVKAQR